MGLFDYIRCSYPLPDGFDGDLKYQTKDTPSQYMESFLIDSDGRLIHKSVRYETVPREERPYPDAEDGSIMALCGSVRAVPTGDVHMVGFSGEVRFYTSNIDGVGPNGYITSDDTDGWNREYVAHFHDGMLVRISGGIDKDAWSHRKRVTREEF